MDPAGEQRFERGLLFVSCFGIGQKHLPTIPRTVGITRKGKVQYIVHPFARAILGNWTDSCRSIPSAVQEDDVIDLAGKCCREARKFGGGDFKSKFAVLPEDHRAVLQM